MFYTLDFRSDYDIIYMTTQSCQFDICFHIIDDKHSNFDEYLSTYKWLIQYYIICKKKSN